MPEPTAPTVSPRTRLLRVATRIGVLAACALLATWIAFGPGARNFAAALPFVGGGRDGEIAGRCAVGIGALAAWAGTLLAAVFGVVAWRTRRDTED